MPDLENLTLNEDLEAPIGTTFDTTEGELSEEEPEGEENSETTEDQEISEDPEIENTRKIIEDGGDFSKIKKLTPDLAVDLLLKNYKNTTNHSYPDLILDGLEEIDKEIAKQLGKYEGHLSLNGLREINEDIAEELGKGKTWGSNKRLSLNGLTEMSEGVAEKLSAGDHYGNYLSLNGLRNISEGVSEILATHRNYLSLNGLTKISEGVANAFVEKGRTDLELNGLTEISEGVAEKLAEVGGDCCSLELNGLRNISEGVAEKLSAFGDGYGDYISLDGLRNISEGVAERLAISEGRTLSLGGLKEISKGVAEKLSAFKGGYENDQLVLNGLINIDIEVAKELAKIEGGLSLNGLTKIDTEVARELGNHKGYLSSDGGRYSYLCLNGLINVDVEVARELAKYKLGLELQGLTEINPEVAAEFAKFEGKTLDLQGINEIDEETAIALIPIKSKLYVQNNIKKKIEKMEKKMLYKGYEMNGALLTLQKKIKKTKEEISWGGERGNIEYDWKTNKIKSRGKETEVEEISENGIKLKGLDLDLTLQEGMWLANFRNWLKQTYGDQEVEHTRGIKSRFWTFYVGRTQIIERDTLEKFCPICKDDDAREKIKDWLNQ